MNALSTQCPLLRCLPTLTTPSVRDLVWTLSAETDLLLTLPPFERFYCTSSAQRSVASEPQISLLRWLKHLDNNPKPLVDFIEAKPNNQRLGLYFEHLLAFYFSYCPLSEYSLLRQGYRIYDEHPSSRSNKSKKVSKKRTTRGELDFLLARGGEITHLEVAVKFFLGHKNRQPKPALQTGCNGISSDQWVWLGPNSQDTWRNKKEHLQTHQLSISSHLRLSTSAESEPAPYLEKLRGMTATDTATIEHRAFCVKGYFFQPWAQAAQLPQEVNPAQCSNHWLPIKDLPGFLAQSQECWYPLEKRQWLTACPSPVKLPNVLEQITHDLETHSRPKMLAARNSATGDRIMVVPNSWPEHGPDENTG